MTRRTLRSRLNTVLLQWFLILALIAGAVLAVSFPGIRHNLVDDRLLLAQTVAHALDTTISGAIQDLGRLAAELPASGPDTQARLRAFRFQSPFAESTYVVDASSRVVAADPPDTQPLPAAWLGSHEAVTPLVHQGGLPVLAIVQPFQRGTDAFYLVSEMNPRGSAIDAFLTDLAAHPDMHLAVIDDAGVVLASPDSSQLLRTLPSGPAYGERIKAHRPLVLESVASELEPEGRAPVTSLTVMAPLRFAPWGVVITQPNAQVFSGLYSGWGGLAVAGLALAAIAVLLSRTLSRSVVRPIQQLSRQAEAMRGGDLSSTISVTGDHEVHVLAETLDDARGRLLTTLGELQTLNESLEQQVAARTRTIEAKFRDLTLLHAISLLCTEERDPARFVPEILRLAISHCGFAAAAVVTQGAGGTGATYIEPPAAVLSWLSSGAPPRGWRRRAIVYRSLTMAALFHPEVAGAEGTDEQVLEALAHQLAIALASAHFWKRTKQQDEQRQVLVRRLLGATEDERKRLARELHDEIAQLLTVIQLSLHHVAVDSPEMQRAKSLLVKTQEDIHRIIHDLRPSLLDDLGLREAMQSYTDDHLVRQGVQVRLEIEDGLPSRPEIETTLFRIYQELVTNVLRHAGAEHVSIEVYQRDGTLICALEDDGRGFDPEAKSDGAGITGMRERAALVNGTVTFDSEPGGGTHAVVEIPFQ